MNVFVLSTGRCGSTTFVAACAHARNFTAGHETRTAFLGDNRFAYPDQHIESDNRLAWLLGRLERAYGDRAFYVHLTRYRAAIAASYNRRWHIPVGIVPAYAEAVLMGNRDRGLASCLDYCDTVDANITAFLKDKTHRQQVALESIERDFQTFWERIQAEGDLGLALAEWGVVHNAGTDQIPESISGAQVRAAWAADPANPKRLSEIVNFLLDSSALAEAAELLRGVLVGPETTQATPDLRETAAQLAETAYARAAHEALDAGRYRIARGLLDDLDGLSRGRAFLPLTQGPAPSAPAGSAAVASAAVTAYQGASTQAKPPEAARLRQAGDAALQQGRGAEAVDAYRRSLALEPAQPRVLNNLGIILGRKDWGEAVPYFEAAFRADPDNPGIQGNLAIALAEGGRLDGAAALVARRDSRIPYPVASNLMGRFARDPAAHIGLPAIAAGIRHLEQLAKLNAVALTDERITLSIFANHLHPAVPWREAALDRLADEDMKQWVEASGVEGLRTALGSGRGAVLVLSHLAAERVATLVLARMGFRLNSLEFRNRLGAHGIRSAGQVSFLELDGKEGFALKEVYQARQALLRGEVFQLAGDGYRGGSQVPCAFLGRTRPFKSGFAELALAAAVPAFPIFCTLSLDGHLRLVVEEVLDAGDPDLPHRERVSRLVRDYAGRLERVWREHPENLVWDHVRRYLELPEADVAAPADA